MPAGQDAPSLTITIKTEPVGFSIVGYVEGDSQESLKQISYDQFEYKRGSAPGDTVILKFSLAAYPEVTKELVINKQG